jgi:hypothetical protein
MATAHASYENGDRYLVTRHYQAGLTHIHTGYEMYLRPSVVSGQVWLLLLA